MSTLNEWQGGAAAVADVWTMALTGTATGPGTLSVMVGTRSVSVAFVNTETAAVVLQRLADALKSSVIPEFLEAAYSDASPITATANVAGIPIGFNTYAVTAAVGLSGATLTNATVATGPNHGDNAGNWSLGHLPGASATEEARIARGPDIKYGLAGMFGGAADATRVMGSFAGGSIGLPKINNSGSAQYPEYRQLYLTCTNAGEIHIGEGAGAGPGLVRMRLASGQKAYVHNAGVPLDENAPAVDFGTAAAPAEVHVYGGSAGYGWILSAAHTCPLASVVGQSTAFYAQGNITVLNQRSGLSVAYGTTATLNIQGGMYTQEEGQINTIVADSGTVRLNQDQGSNQIAATFRGSMAGEPPVLDATANDRTGKTLANTSKFTGGAYILNPYRSVTITGVTFDRQSLNASILGNDVYAVTVV